MANDANQQHPTYQDDSVLPVQQPLEDLQEPEIVPVSFSPGSPESAPIPVAKENANESVEYGYEQLKQVETTNENLSQIERKEPIPSQTQGDNQLGQKAPPPIPLVPAQKPQGPKIFGYYIPPSITSNLANIKQKKGRGNPQDATTWIYVLLDRLLKKQTYKD